MKDPRAYALGHLSLVLFLSASSGHMLTMRAQTAATVQPVTEYANTPISTGDLQRGVRRAQLIVLGQILEYAANRDVEDTVVVVAETYKGSVQPGERISIQCVCHHEAAPDPASRIGHHVILFLNKKPAAGPWRPAVADYMFFFHAELRARILRVLGASDVKRARP